MNVGGLNLNKISFHITFFYCISVILLFICNLIMFPLYIYIYIYIIIYYYYRFTNIVQLKPRLCDVF